MLTLTRNHGGRVLIYPSDSVPDDMTVKELFADGPMEIVFVNSWKQHGSVTAKIGFEAPKPLMILREEKFLENPPAHVPYRFLERRNPANQVTQENQANQAEDKPEEAVAEKKILPFRTYG